MSAIQLLNLGPADCERWGLALARWGDQADIYFQYPYMEAAALLAGGEPRCVLVEEDGAAFLLPYLWCSIPGKTRHWDVQGAYGYGGPLFLGGDAGFLRRAWKLVEDDWKSAGGVAAFIRLHPLLDNGSWTGPGWERRADRETVSIDLSQGIDAAFSGHGQKTHRSQVSRARREGLVVAEVSCTTDAMSIFAALYYETMTRLGAAEYYHFPEAYWQSFAGSMSPMSSVFRLECGGGRVAMALVLWGRSWGHYHLSARSASLPNSASNLLLQGIAEAAALRGKCGVHLGGGRTTSPGDTLFAFKSHVGSKRHVYATASRILDRKRFDRLTEQWVANHPGRKPRWFLCYREV